MRARTIESGEAAWEARAHAGLEQDLRRVGPFLVGRELARGGMASVHEATHDRASAALGEALEPELFAIKLVLPELVDDANFVEMFLDEARIASRIRHPNVCRVFRFGEVDSAMYLTMELLRGSPLGALRRASATLLHRADRRWHRVVARIVADACAGLHAAHELRDADGRPLHVVHRDVSPQNVFVCRDGSVKLLDFGIASAEHRLHKTSVGVVKGKFAYIAPEQILSAPSDRRADLWSLGVVLWELLAGRALFRRRCNADTIGAVLRPYVPVIEGVPPELMEVVRASVQPDPSMRLGTAQAMQDRLEHWLRANGDCKQAEVAACCDSLVPGDSTRPPPLRSSRPPPRATPVPTAARETRSREPTLRQSARERPSRITLIPAARRPSTRQHPGALALVGPTLLALIAALAVWSLGRAFSPERAVAPETSLQSAQSSARLTHYTQPTP